MSINLTELLAKPYNDQRRHITFTLGKADSCMIVNAVMRNTHAHSLDDVPLLMHLRNQIDVETAVDYHNRSEQVTQRINTRSDAVAVWGEIYNQYIPSIVALTNAGNGQQAQTAIMTMLAKVESEY